MIRLLTTFLSYDIVASERTACIIAYTSEKVNIFNHKRCFLAKKDARRDGEGLRGAREERQVGFKRGAGGVGGSREIQGEEGRKI